MPETVVHIQVRMSPALYEKLASRAQEERTSLNALMITILREAAGRHETEGAIPPPE